MSVLNVPQSDPQTTRFRVKGEEFFFFYVKSGSFERRPDRGMTSEHSRRRLKSFPDKVRYDELRQNNVVA